MIDHEAAALTLLCIRAEADSDVHAREAMARYFVSQVGEEGTGDDQLSLGGWQEEEQGWDWPEWLASDQHPIGKPFQGPSGRWFVRKDVGDGKSRVVPAPNPDKAKAAPKEKAPAKPQDKAAPTKRSASVPKTKVSVEETWAKVQDALKGGGSAEDAVQALAGLGLADIRKLRDQHKGEKGGRSKSEVAQRLITAVKADIAAEKAAREQPAAKLAEPQPATPAHEAPTAPDQASGPASLPPVPPGKKLSKDYPEEGIRVVTDANGDNRTTLTTPSPEAVQKIAPVLKKAFEMALMYDESSGGLVPLQRLVTEIEPATPEGQKITRREIFDALKQLDKSFGMDLHVLNETWVFTDQDRAAINHQTAGPLDGYDDIDSASLWDRGRPLHFVSLAKGVSSVDQAIQKGIDGPAAKQDKSGFTGTDALGREWQDGKLVAAKEEPAGPGQQAKQVEPAPTAKPAAVKPQSKPKSAKPAKPEAKTTPAPAAKPEVTTDTIRQAWGKLPGAKDNLVSLADLKDALGVDTPTLHRLVNDLRRKGVLTAQNLENRTGTQAEKDRLKAAGIPDGQNTIGYVAMVDDGRTRAEKPSRREPLNARVVREHPPETKPELDADDIEAIKGYASVGQWAEDVNKALRGIWDMYPETQKVIDAMSRAVRKAKPMKEPIACERYMDGNEQTMAQFAQLMRQAVETDSVVRLPGFTSTTTGFTNKHTAWMYQGMPVKMKIAVRQGLSLRDYSEVPMEEEILLDHNSSFRVRSVTKVKHQKTPLSRAMYEGDAWEIELEQVLPGEE
ncbi:MAG: hypothetical protein E6Q97_10175 [Desulfurellales bacterium]|nr:MAG: hypothetical protein E6Q97_10175 [Desulfurellales bacterium]